MKDLVEARAVNEIGRTAEIVDGGLFAEGSLGAQHCDSLRGLECQARRHDFAPDRRHMQIFQWTRIAVLHLLDDLRDAVGPEKGGALTLFDFAYLLGNVCTLVEQSKQLLIE